MADRFHLYLTAYDHQREGEIAELLARISGQSSDEMRTALQGALPLLLAASLPKAQAEQLCARLQSLGATAVIRAPGTAVLEPGTKAQERDTGGEGGAPRSPSGGGDVCEPLGFRGRLRWAFRIAWRTGGQVLLLDIVAMVAAGLTLALGIAVAGLFGVDWSLFTGGSPSLPKIAQSLLSGISVFITIFLVAMFLMSLVMVWIQAAYLQIPVRFFEHGARPPLRALVVGAWQRTPDFFMTTAAMTLLMALPAFLPVVAGWAGASGLFALLSLLAQLVAAILLLALFGLAPAVVANEPVGTIVALRRAVRLSRGRRLAMVGNLLLLLIAVMLVMFGLEMLLMVVAGAVSALAPSLSGVVSVVLGLLLMLAIQVIILLLFYHFITLFYVEARICDEGWRPAWQLAPVDGWSLGRNHVDDAQWKTRARRGWVILVLGTALGVAVFAGGVVLVGDHLRSGMTLLMQKLSMATVSTGRSHVGQAGSGRVLRHAKSSGSDLSAQAYRLYQQGKYTQSIHLLDALLQGDPNNAWALYTRGWAKWKLHQSDEARADMARACAFNYLDACKLAK